jgi:predicted TIM-barrel enzyme
MMFSIDSELRLQASNDMVSDSIKEDLIVLRKTRFVVPSLALSPRALERSRMAK